MAGSGTTERNWDGERNRISERNWNGDRNRLPPPPPLTLNPQQSQLPPPEDPAPIFHVLRLFFLFPPRKAAMASKDNFSIPSKIFISATTASGLAAGSIVSIIAAKILPLLNS
jgi:hypothetical protein